MISFCILYLPKDTECHCSLHHCQSTCTCFTSMNSNWHGLIVFFSLHLLLSGDVELNPGPMIDDQPDIFLLRKWLEPLVDWQPFGLLLPGITQQDIAMIAKSALGIETEHQSQKLILYCKWINKHPEAKWRDVLHALTVREETELAQTIKDKLHEGQCIGGGSVNVATCNSVGVYNKEPVSDLVKGNPNDIFRSHSDKLTDAVTTNLYRLADALHAKGLIPLDTKRDMYSVSGDNELKKAGKLLITLQTLMKSSQHPEQYLIDVCHVLVNQQNQALTDIATSMMKQLGKHNYVCIL
uniref:Death domain-containing protein n=1 Tax=Amphimedon queenslandica TaxID=400682 RepID=A0A1X7TGE2_AMPQE